MPKFGVPYMGSKARLAVDLISLMPCADMFVDVFAGGCAMAAAALVSGKYKSVLVNDLDGRGVKLWMASYSGVKFPRRWISREDFLFNSWLPHDFQDPFVALVWSFGNNMSSYMMSRESEDRHYAEFLRGDYYEYERRRRRVLFQSTFPRLPVFECFSDYKSLTVNYNFPQSAVFYCDPPYADTSSGGYSSWSVVDRFEFLSWASDLSWPVFISESSLSPSLDFPLLFEKVIPNSFAGLGAHSFRSERLFCSARTLDIYPSSFTPVFS